MSSSTPMHRCSNLVSRALVVVAFLLLAVALPARALDIPDKPTAWVTDKASVLDANVDRSSTAGDGALASAPRLGGHLGVLWPQPQPLYVSSTPEHTKAAAAAAALQDKGEDLTLIMGLSVDDR